MPMILYGNQLIYIFRFRIIKNPVSREYQGLRGEYMRKIIAAGLILLALALSSHAFATLQLGGDSGRAILQKITANNTTNDTANQTAQLNNTTKDLWAWGKAPVGHVLDKSGKLVETPKDPVLVEIQP